MTPSQLHQIVILGAGYAGMAAALRLAQHHLPHTAITLVNASPLFVERIRLHQVAAGGYVRQRPIARLIAGTGIRFVPGRVLALDTAAQQVSIATEAGRAALRYDTLLYALGSIADKISVPGIAEHMLAAGDPAEAARLRAALGGLPAGGQVVVVGGGLTGIETAAEIAEAYPALRVRLLTASTLGSGLSAGGQAYIRRTLARLGVLVQEQQGVQQITAHALQTSGGIVPFDIGVWAGSFRALPLAQEAGLAVNARGQILVDARLCALSAPAVFAAGDAAALAPETGLSLRMACATAIPLGVHAADNVAARLRGAALQPFGFGYALQCISLGRRDGLIQFVDAADRPNRRLITGRLAAVIKEGVCRYAFASASARWLVRHYRWPGAATRTAEGILAHPAADTAREV